MTTEYAHAKINLYLDVTAKRADGYHEIRSLMQTVSLRDVVRMEIGGAPGVRFSCSDPALARADNLAVRAAQAYLQAVDREETGLFLELQKHIPVAAGLAGGSADAAAVLRGLNRLFGSPLHRPQLLEIALQLGADVPFCLVGGCALCTGIGEITEPAAGLPEDKFVVVTRRGAEVNTGLAYAALDRMYGDFKRPRASRPSVHFNVFESVVPEQNGDVETLKRLLLESGAEFAMMSGSGPSVFGVFSVREQAERAVSRLESEGAFGAVCRPDIYPFSVE